MPADDLDGRTAPGKPHQTELETALLGDMVEAGIAVHPRPDLGAVEIRIRDRGREQSTVLVLGPDQALAVAELLVGAVLILGREGDR